MMRTLCCKMPFLWVATVAKEKFVNFFSISCFVPPSIGRAFTFPGNHLLNSLYQFWTKEEGQTIMAFSISGQAKGDCFNKVQIKVMHCNVFPNPISSAMIQP
eukprot:Lithocolla_globosa_v1_NODE_10623_length_583_cov_1.649621.p2 type:complete len:102 gc:universal NODE_10623_length_583_cov_1.649621:518-213(-)